MRQQRSQFALVEDDTGLLGLVTMQDLLDRLLPRLAHPASHRRRANRVRNGPDR